MHTDKYLYLDNYIHCLALQRMANDGKCNGYYSMVIHPSFPFVSFQLVCLYRTTRININLININPNDYYNPVIDYYNPLLRFEPCLDQLGLLLILCRININQININPNIRSSNRLL